MDSSVVAIWAETLDGVVTSWNAASTALYRHAAADIVGRPATVLVPDDRRAEHDALRRRARAGEVIGYRRSERLRGDGARIEVSEAVSPIHGPDGAIVGLSSISRDSTAYVHRDGTKHPFLLSSSAVHDEAGEVVGFTGIGVDISRAREAAQELHSARELFESSFESAPMGIVLVRADGDRPGSLMRVNRAMGRIVGRDPAALVGRHFYDLIPEEDVADLLPSVECLLAGLDGGYHHTDVRFRGADGQPVWAELSMSLIRDAEGEPLHAVALVQDITLARRAQAEKEALEARLHQAQRLDGIGRLAGGIAHDFNNLLSVIINYADLVAEDLPDDAPRGDVEQIREAAERASALTRQLLVFGRQEVVQPRPVDLNAIVADTQKLLRRTIGEDVELRTQLASDLPAVRADRSQLEQVLLNLALNGRDAMPEGGVLTITTSISELGSIGARRAGLPPGRYVCLDVIDDGIGMSPEVADRAFEPFFTTKQRGAGTGLGLATVYGIVTAAGGQIDCHSADGEGSAFRIALPACAAELARPVVEAAEPAPGRGETVLVVEDEPAVRALAARLLTDGGYRVLEAGRPEDALVAAGDAPPDLLLTDVVMPGMSGTDLGAELRRTHPDLRILFMSGYTDDVVMRHGILERRVSFVEKPFSRASLLDAVRATLDDAMEAPHVL